MAEKTPAKIHNIVIVTGMSGAGRSSSLKIFEDLGFEAIDNLPIPLLENLIEAMGPPHETGLAVGLDIRSRAFESESLLDLIRALRTRPDVNLKILFLDATADSLQRRFSETRRRHPLAQDRPVLDGIRLERERMAPLLDAADLRLDTSSLSIWQLKDRLAQSFAIEGQIGLSVFVMSFSYRNGVPKDADLVFDVRFLNNPHYDRALRPLTGQDRDVGAFIELDPSFDDYYETVLRMLSLSIPRYKREGKSYLTICFGCTGGKHRSVYLAERFAQWCSEENIRHHVLHRELSGKI